MRRHELPETASACRTTHQRGFSHAKVRAVVLGGRLVVEKTEPDRTKKDR
jgi:hypothetical protein